MLHLVIGTDWTANRCEIINRISADVHRGMGRRILLVPELISHDTERRLCEAAGDTASRYAEVLSFSRLASRVTERMGNRARQCLDNGGRVVAMAAAARSLHSRLKAYASVETKPEFLTDLLDAVDEFKRCCITAEDLKHAASQTEGSFAQKLEELSLLLDAYDGLCAQGKRDPRDMETLLLEQLEDSDYGENHIFYIDGFPDFTRQHLAILEHLIRVSPNVTISMNCDVPSSKRLAFEKTGDTAAQLIRIAQKAGVEVCVETVNPNPLPLSPLREFLFQGDINLLTEPVKALSVYRGESVYQECLGAAEKVMDLVRGGCRYRDISIVCGDMATYQNVLDLVFHRCDIPLYRSGTDDILQKSIISGILSALDAVLGGFDRKDVMRYLRSALSPLDPDLCDQVENYGILWGIRGNRWLTVWENHPDGLGSPWTEESTLRLASLEQARKLALVPLARLGQGFKAAASLKQQVEALYDFMEEIGLARRMEQLSARMEASGDDRSAQILNQLWEILLTALEQLHDVLGHTAWDDQTFTRLFTLLLSQYNVGTIPPVLDAVMAGPVSAMRCQEPKHLIVLGAEEGNLPGYGGSTGVLTDRERVQLRDLGVPLTGGALEGLQAEFAEIYGVFCGARESVTVSWSGAQPSFVCRRLADMAGQIQPWEPKFGAALAGKNQAGAFLASFGAEDAAIRLGIHEEYRQICDLRDHELGDIRFDHVQALYGSKLNLSASQVDRQAECRFSYFLKYGLRATERKEATIDPAEFGTYVHAVLEQTGRKVMELGGFHQVSLEDTLQIASEISDQYARERFGQLESKRLSYLFQRNGQELELILRELWQELHLSEFVPVDFETDFGGKTGLSAIHISGRKMSAQLRGFVDRVDAWTDQGRNYFRIVDYKTGKKDFDYCDVFNGIGLQMLLYLFALAKEGQPILGENPIPAGVQYFPARVPVMASDGRLEDEAAENLRQREWKRRGLLLKDEDVLKAMDPEESGNRLGVTRKKDGTLTGDLADRDQLKQLRDYIYLVLGRMVDDISSGNVDPNPYTRGSVHNACTFCPYGTICHKEQVEGRRNYKAMSAQRFWDELGKELESRG